MTKREAFNAIRELVSDNTELVAFVDHELELLANKAASKKPTKTQVENDNFKCEIIAYLTATTAMLTIKEIQAAIPSLAELTSQRVSRLLNDLVKAETLSKTYIKKVPYFAINF